MSTASAACRNTLQRQLLEAHPYCLDVAIAGAVSSCIVSLSTVGEALLVGRAQPLSHLPGCTSDVEPPSKRQKLDVTAPVARPRLAAASPLKPTLPSTVLAITQRDPGPYACIVIYIVMQPPAENLRSKQRHMLTQSAIKAEAPSATPPCRAQRGKVVRTPVKEPQELPAESAAKATGAVTLAVGSQ